MKTTAKHLMFAAGMAFGVLYLILMGLASGGAALLQWLGVGG